MIKTYVKFCKNDNIALKFTKYYVIFSHFLTLKLNYFT